MLVNVCPELYCNGVFSNNCVFTLKESIRLRKKVTGSGVILELQVSASDLLPIRGLGVLQPVNKGLMGCI